MLVLKTIVHETIWGGHRVYKMANVKGNMIGHLYSVFCREGMSNEILNGQHAGKTINEIFPLFKESVGMGKYMFFPITIALTDAGENLSVQVHPNDEVANIIEHKAHGKRESWYFLEAPKEGSIINGCTCKTLEERDKLIDDGRYLEIVDYLKVCAGDYVFVEPGTLHSITAGSLVYEIEEGADYTYRFYDYDRKDINGNLRELHIEKARMALDISAKSKIKHYTKNEEIVEKTYATKKIEYQCEYKNDTISLVCFTLVAGNAVCDGVPVSPGMSVILWPEEQISNAAIELAFVARMRI